MGNQLTRLTETRRVTQTQYMGRPSSDQGLVNIGSEVSSPKVDEPLIDPAFILPTEPVVQPVPSAPSITPEEEERQIWEGFHLAQTDPTEPKDNFEDPPEYHTPSYPELDLLLNNPPPDQIKSFSESFDSDDSDNYHDSDQPGKLENLMLEDVPTEIPQLVTLDEQSEQTDHFPHLATMDHLSHPQQPPPPPPPTVPQYEQKRASSPLHIVEPILTRRRRRDRYSRPFGLEEPIQGQNKPVLSPIAETKIAMPQTAVTEEHLADAVRRHRRRPPKDVDKAPKLMSPSLTDSWNDSPTWANYHTSRNSDLEELGYSEAEGCMVYGHSKAVVPYKNHREELLYGRPKTPEKPASTSTTVTDKNLSEDELPIIDLDTGDKVRVHMDIFMTNPGKTEVWKEKMMFRHFNFPGMSWEAILEVENEPPEVEIDGKMVKVDKDLFEKFRELPGKMKQMMLYRKLYPGFDIDMVVKLDKEQYIFLNNFKKVKIHPDLIKKYINDPKSWKEIMEVRDFQYPDKTFEEMQKLEKENSEMRDLRMLQLQEEVERNKEIERNKELQKKAPKVTRGRHRVI